MYITYEIFVSWNKELELEAVMIDIPYFTVLGMVMVFEQ